MKTFFVMQKHIWDIKEILTNKENEILNLLYFITGKLYVLLLHNDRHFIVHGGILVIINILEILSTDDYVCS